VSWLVFSAQRGIGTAVDVRQSFPLDWQAFRVEAAAQPCHGIPQMGGGERRVAGVRVI